MNNDTELKKLLKEIDHRGYPAYKRLAGAWKFNKYSLSFDHVQGDPFASPSNVSVLIDGRNAGFPFEYYNDRNRRVALRDHLLRLFSGELSHSRIGNAGSGKSGLLFTSVPGQEILERSALEIDEGSGSITARFELGLPARGRTVTVEPLEHILFSLLPGIIKRTLIFNALDKDKLKAVMELSDDTAFLRTELKRRSLCAFVANGSILPRESGVSQRPMKSAIPFQSPKDLEIEITLPHKGSIRGMGINTGIFLIVGGGYHGKSTLLSALERGVYDHIAGDGREYVITDADAVKIRAEDGRSVRGADVSMFINDLPSGIDTSDFNTEDASGSTSQAANVVEAIEGGASLLLIDEDTCATNFMVRDELMRSVVSDSEESITPFLLRMRRLYEECGISTILVAGSSGSFFSVADTVIQMDEYVPVDVTEKARKVWESAGIEQDEPPYPFRLPSNARIPFGIFDWKKPGARVKSKVLTPDSFSLDRQTVDLRAVSQLVDREQTYALALCLKALARDYFDGKRELTEAVEQIFSDIEKRGFAVLCGRMIPSGIALPRRHELLAAVNRWRRLKLR